MRLVLIQPDWYQGESTDILLYHQCLENKKTFICIFSTSNWLLSYIGLYLALCQSKFTPDSSIHYCSSNLVLIEINRAKSLQNGNGNPAIPDWRSRRKLGDHGEHGKDWKHQPDELRHSIYVSKEYIRDSKHSICQPDDTKHSFLQHLS